MLELRARPRCYDDIIRVDDIDRHLLTMYKWHIHRDANGAPRRVIARDELTTKTLARVVTGCPSGWVVDHISGDVLDNRRSNLRLCRQAENSRNRKKPVTNTSGYKGVCEIPTLGARSWRAQICVDKGRRHLGCFPSPELAARAYDRAAIELHGQFARINFPEGL